MSLGHGAEWAQALENQIHACGAFVPVMSDYSRNTPWGQREILLAQELGKPILPLLLSGNRFWELADLHYEDVATGAIVGAENVVRAAQHGRAGDGISCRWACDSISCGVGER